MRILYSTSRNALRAQCLREVCELTSVWPDQRAILLVPEQTKMDMERDYLEISGQSGLMMAEVLSFRRLAWRLLGEIGHQPKQAVDSIGQGMLIHRVLKQNQSELHSFGHLADQPGFIRQAAAALGDLKRYQVEAGSLLAAGETSTDRALQNKAHDLGILLREYDRALAETGLCDGEDDLNRLGLALQSLAAQSAGAWDWPLNRLEWLRRTSIWVSGFGETRDFTPQEDAILIALNQLAANLTLTLAADHLPFDRLAVDNGADCFLAGRRTAWRLQQILPASRVVPVPDPSAGLPARISAAIQEGRRCLPDPDPEIQAADSGSLRLIRAEGRDDELTWVAGEIRRLVQTEGFRYRDITLAVCDLPGYTPRLRAACREYGIPLFLDAERPLSGTPLLRLVLGLLDTGLRNWARDAVMACLRSGLTPLDMSEIDLLENEMLARGVTRPSHLADDRRFPSPGLAAIRARAFDPWRQVLSDLKLASAGNAKCQILKHFLHEYGLAGRISQRSAQLVDEGEMDAALALVQAWNELDRLLDQLTQLAADTPMSLQVFRDTLAAGMEAAGSGVIPTAIDQVAVGDLRRAMLRQSRVLFLIGASAASLPPGQPPEGLLKDQDRQVLSGLLNRQLPSSARDQAFVDAYVIHALLTQPSDRLYMTAPDAAVSSWFTWLATAAGPTGLQLLPSRPSWPDSRLNALRPAFGYFLSFCGQQMTRPVIAGPVIDDWRLLARIFADAGLPLDHASAWLRQNANLSQALQVRLPSGLIRSLYADPLTMSVSQLEKYASCPFLHLATYLLALQERPVWAPEAAETGTLLHGIIELAIADLRRELAGIDPEDPEARRRLLDRWLQHDLDNRIQEWMRSAADREDLMMFFDVGLRASAGFRVRRLASASLEAILLQYQAERYLPVSLEWTFGPQAAHQLYLPLPNGELLAFQGKIDRIDRMAASPTGFIYRIIDYKSGNKKADHDALYHGLALQLPVYLEAYSLACPDSRAEDAAYFHFERPILTVADGIKPSPEQMRQNLSKRYALRGLKLSPDQLVQLRRHSMIQAARLAGCLLAGDFAVSPSKIPGRKPACEYCVVRAVCGFDGQPAGYHWLPTLSSRTPAGGRAGRRNELAIFLQEQYPSEPAVEPTQAEESETAGGAEDATHT